MVVKTPAGEKIPKVGEDPGDQTTAWRQVLHGRSEPLAINT